MQTFNSDTSCMRFLALVQICQPMEFDLLVESLRYYRELHSRLFKLYELRQHGVSTLYGAALFRRLNKHRQQAQRDYARQKQQVDAFDWQHLVQHYENNRNGEKLPLGITSKQYALSSRRKASPIEIAGSIP